MYICIVDRDGNKLVHRKLRCRPEYFLRAVQDYRNELTVSCECMFAWYWLADLCAAEGIEFALGHALYMKAIHQGKTKNDKVDSEKIARLTQSGLLPVAYVYPPQLRGLRDLLRRRLKFVRTRAALYVHIHNLCTQANLPVRLAPKSKKHRDEIPQIFENPDVQISARSDIDLMRFYDTIIQRMETYILRRAKDCRPKEMHLLQSIPGVGMITALTILLELDTVNRFPTRQDFASYSRLVKCPRESDGKLYGSGGKKMGNPYLKWAFSEAAVHAAEWCEPVNHLLKKMEARYGKGKGKSLLAHKLGRTVYYMLLRGTVFDEAKFLNIQCRQPQGV
jgi:transposase